MARRWGHPTDADWAAYLAGEVDGRERLRLGLHLRACAGCQGTLERVDAIVGLLELPVPEPDELSWRRMEARLADATRPPGETRYLSIDLPPAAPGAPAPEWSTPPDRTVDIVRGRRWLLAGLAAAAVVAAFILLAPRSRRPSPPGPSTAATAQPSGRSAVVKSGAAPLEVELESGVRLTLSSWTDLVVPEPDATPARIELDHGRVDVWALRSFGDSAREEPPIMVRTPELRLWARSRDFTVSYQAGRHRVEVREGSLRVEGSDVADQVEAGQTRSYVRPWAGPAEPPLSLFARLQSRSSEAEAGSTPAGGPPRSTPGRSSSISAPPARSGPPAQGGSMRPEPRDGQRASEREVSGEGPSAPPRPGAPRIRPPAEEPTTTVEMLGPALGEAELALAEAEDAWYKRRDPDWAIRAAERVRSVSDDLGLVRAALQIQCDAEVSVRSGRRALQVCAALLDAETDPGQRRRLHYRLATILRDQLGDCRRALDHYGRALVFGARTRFDDVVRLGRAECALDLGRTDVAAVDLDGLEASKVDAVRLQRARERLGNLRNEAPNGP